MRSTMPKKKGHKHCLGQDFTINDSANAVKPVNRIKKVNATEATAESWEEINTTTDLDLIEEYNEDGTKCIVYKKRRNKSEFIEISDQPGTIYPEIVWYLISPYIKPEDVGRFAGINKATYCVTQRESFWRNLYKKYCNNNAKLPSRLRLENCYVTYGLRQRVIRALYYTYDIFTSKVLMDSTPDSKPHQLVKRQCVNVWFTKGAAYWSVFLKLKKVNINKRIENYGTLDILKELGRIDANPEEDTQVLQIACQSIHEVPPLMGMTLSSVSVVLAQGFRHHKIHLGFNHGLHNVSKDILPECSLVLDTVIKIYVSDWWHPRYPNFDNRLPSKSCDDERLPMLKKDFFQTCDRERDF